MITGGGTGGHTSPGLAVATALQQRGVPHVWIGSRDGIEARRAAEQSITYYAIPTGKLRRYWAWRNISDLAINVPAGVLAAHRLVRRLRPRAVLATGGFVALPVVAGAAAARVPIVVHEQTAVPGLANRLAARLAQRVAVSFAESGRHFPRARVVVTGNPLRPDLRAGTRADAVARFGLDPALPLVYVTGGALGAHAINRAVGAMRGRSAGPGPGHPPVRRQPGDGRLRMAAGAAGRRCRRRWRAATPFCRGSAPSCAAIYAAASLVVGRAGAGTVNECCQLGVPALYVPLPGASGDEQTANARLVTGPVAARHPPPGRAHATGAARAVHGSLLGDAARPQRDGRARPDAGDPRRGRPTRRPLLERGEGRAGGASGARRRGRRPAAEIEAQRAGRTVRYGAAMRFGDGDQQRVELVEERGIRGQVRLEKGPRSS